MHLKSCFDTRFRLYCALECGEMLRLSERIYCTVVTLQGIVEVLHMRCNVNAEVGTVLSHTQNLLYFFINKFISPVLIVVFDHC